MHFVSCIYSQLFPMQFCTYNHGVILTLERCQCYGKGIRNRGLRVHNWKRHFFTKVATVMSDQKNKYIFVKQG